MHRQRYRNWRCAIIWLCSCSRHPLMPTDAQIIFFSLPSGVPKGMVACLVNYLMIKMHCPQTPLRLWSWTPLVDLHPPLSPILNSAVTHLSFTVWVSIYCPVKSLLHIVSCSSAYACCEFCTPLPLQHSPCVTKWRQNAAYVLLTRLLHVSPAVTSANNVTGIFLWCLCVRIDLSHEFINKNRIVQFFI